MRTWDYQRYIVNHASGSTVKHTSPKTILSYAFSLPPLPTQRAIAATLSCLDDKIELNNRINANLEAQAQAIFESWFMDFEPWGGVMPDDWRECPLSNLVQNIDNRGKTPPFASHPTDYPIIDVKALAGEQRIIDYSGCTKYVEEETYNTWFRSGHPQPYDILLSTVGSLAEMKLFLGNRGCIAQNVVGFRTEKMLSLYLFQYLQFIKDDLVLYNIGSVQPSIKVTHIIKHPIVVPKNDILTQFNEILDPITNEMYKLHCQNEYLAAIRDALLPRLMSGEIEVKDVLP
jgi:type I restriction enzyme S subunit